MEKGWKNIRNLYQNLFWKNYNYYKERESLKNFIELVLTSVAIVVFSLFALRPTATTIIEINKEIKAKKETLSKMETKIKNLQNGQVILSREQEGINLLETAIPSRTDPEIVLRQLEAASNESGTKIKSISVKDVIVAGKTQASDKSKLPENSMAFGVSLQVSGKYEDLIKAIQTYENLTRIIILDQFSLQTQKNDEQETGTLNLNIGARALYFVNKEEPSQSTQNENKKEDSEVTKSEEPR